jgi:alanine racemase
MLTWVEVDTDALASNLTALGQRLPSGAILAPAVKGNAYGHGLILAAKAFAGTGAQMLCVNAVYEARTLRAAGIDIPLYVVGYVEVSHLGEALQLGCELVVYNTETVDAIEALAPDRPARLHVKLETGNNRQGLSPDLAFALAKRIAGSPSAHLAGIASHYANVEDTTDHTYARAQLQRFHAFARRLREAGFAPGSLHMSNSAAAIIWPEECLDIVRVGISAYGMWPSKETLVAALMSGRKDLNLRPALTWKCRIAQIKEVPAGAFIGYGCSHRTTHPTRIAVLPIGYYDGYDRGLSNTAHVLISGHRAPVLGRVCMNVVMVDVTNVPNIKIESEVVLLGASGAEEITAEQMADWAGTINYEITTRINDRIPRIPRGSQGGTSLP